ncbi:DEAD/DEAH box helicase [Solwaraspora sp. WMMD406]|uniref:DEAD/DEAH box helicase n=1 Tax=Solwaraspora sp. WMMD406 TaxID=3016095 RepID=UPI002417FF37|nr:DEAD/DEAH box helicase [Solwaraspora sp. WMMD406]MDG4765042.1 DEAD/DEAH box helicase [Solwaraspora sp. WMMD406]
MLVVHGLLSPGGRLALWAEDSRLPAAPPRRPGRPPRRRPHPFAADLDRLAAALTPILDTVVAKATTASAALVLPTVTGRPMESPELVRTQPVDATTGSTPVAGTASWLVPTLEFDVDEALSVLCTLHDAADGDPDVTVAASVRHLALLAGFAAELVARGRVVPAVRADRDEGTATACWLPVLTGADRQWARSLAAAVPPAAMSAALPAGSGPAALPAGSGSAAGTRSSEGSGRLGSGLLGSGARVVAAALDALTDAAARAVLDGVRLADRRSGSGVLAVRDAWLSALTGRQRAFAAPAGPLATLRAGLDDWHREVAVRPVRACFRLREPATTDAPQPPAGVGAAGLGAAGDTPAGDAGAGDAGAGDAGAGDAAPWRLEFALQATDEPSLVVDAEQIWRGGDGLRPLTRHTGTPPEALLAELGRASRLWPAIEDALRTATPDGLDLDVDGAHRFLRDGAPALHAAGFTVLLPSWWHGRGARLGARLRVTSRTAPGAVQVDSRFGQADLVDYQWEVALGEQQLTEAELRELARAKTPLVRLRGQWVEVDAKRLAAGLSLLRSGGRLSLVDLLRLALGEHDDGDPHDEGDLPLPVLGVSADGALGDLLSGQADRRLVPVSEPPGFRGQLRPYQRRGVAWLRFLHSIGLGGVLADDMGLGKTVQLLAMLAADEPHVGPTLLICPMSLVGNWCREAATFVPDLTVHVHHGAERPRREAFAAAVTASRLVITTYAVATRDAAELAEIAWHRIMVDEAQAIKNAATRQSVAIRSLPARHRVAITGTPVENRLADLWSIMDFANPGLLGPAATFRKRYAEPVERHGDVEAAERLRRITGPFVLRRLKTDRSIIADLPEKLEMEVLCNLTAEQASLYQAVVDDMMRRIESSTGMERRGLVLATMTKLKQVCNHPAQFLRDGSHLAGRSGKLARLTEILDEVLAAGEKALLFTQYAEFGAMLRGHLSAYTGREVLFLHGGLTKADRDTQVARFQHDSSGPPIFVLSLKAGGTGLTLTAANHVVHVDRWWNPAVEDQATDRAFRIGQRRAVQVRKFVCAGTAEEKIAAMVADKRGLAASIVGSGEQWLTELSTTQLRELFALEAGAVVE